MGEYPSQWSKGYIHPIQESGEKDNPLNYRGIVINSCIGKLFTKILYVSINERFDEKYQQCFIAMYK
jgi:hypothetical protein